MFVRDYMQKDPITICGEATLPEAAEFLRREGVLTLPVMNGKKVIGVVTDRDIRKAGHSSAPALHHYELDYLLEKVKVSDIMSSMVVSIFPDATVEEAAKLLHDREVKGLPVIENGELVGLITVNEVLEFFNSLFEKTERGATFELKMSDQTETLTQALSIISSHGCNIVSMLTAPVEKGGSTKEAIVSLECDDIEGTRKDLEARELILHRAD